MTMILSFVYFKVTQCVLCMVHLIEVCFLFVTEVTNPNDRSVFGCVVGPGFDWTSPAFVRSRASQAAGSDGRLAQKTESGRHNGGNKRKRSSQHTKP